MIELKPAINEVKLTLKSISSPINLGTVMEPVSGGSVPTDVRQAIYTLLENAAYVTTGLEDEIAIVQAWAQEVTALSLSVTSLSLSDDTPQTIVATVVPAGSTVLWSSSNEAVATVSNGVVTGAGNGSCVITATAGGKSANCAVTVSGFATLESISAVYTQSGTVYDTDSLDSLKADLVVTATYSDTSTETVPSTDYTLSGTLTVGTSTITVAYGGKTATFSVTVSTHALFEILNKAVNKTELCVDTNIAIISTDRTFTILFDAYQENAIPSGSANRLFGAIGEDSNWKGIFCGGPNSNSVYGVQWQTGNTSLTGFNRQSTNTRIRIAYSHEANSGKAKISYKINNNAVQSATQTATFVSCSSTLKFGGISSTPSENWVGTLNRCTLYDVVLSNDEIDSFFA